MNKQLRNIIIAIVAVVVVGAGVFLVRLYLVGGSGEASEAISAPTLEAVESSSMSSTLFRIVPEESETRFILDEVLRGSPKTVIGMTNQIAGDIRVDAASPASSEIGEIRINARTLSTDNDFRNRAIRADILQSGQDAFEYITFTPTAMSGLPESAAAGDTLAFQVTGDLTIRDITQPVTFEVSLTYTAERLEGSAKTTVQRADYNLIIPNVPNVANVSEEVQLELDFVAIAVAE